VVRSSLATCLHAVAGVKVIEVYLGLKRRDLPIFWDGKSPIDEVIGISIDVFYLELFALTQVLNITESSEMLLAFSFISYSPLGRVLLLCKFRFYHTRSPNLPKGPVQKKTTYDLTKFHFNLVLINDKNCIKN
jgi:hypothetical protein